MFHVALPLDLLAGAAGPLALIIKPIQKAFAEHSPGLCLPKGFILKLSPGSLLGPNPPPRDPEGSPGRVSI